MMSIQSICNCLLNESSAPDELHGAVDEFVMICRKVSGICPDPGFQAWSGDEFLDHGVAINPGAAAQCALDYWRTVVFIRGVYAAMRSLKARSDGTPLDILYAGCGPFATLLLPLLGRFEPGEINVTLLDIHQSSLDSVQLLSEHFDCDHCLRLVRGNACRYQHPRELHLVIAETMQKALEQEPQFAVTANLAPQLRPGGIFIPQQIQVDLSLAASNKQQNENRQPQLTDQQALPRGDSAAHLATVFTLSPEHAAAQLQSAIHNVKSKMLELEATTIAIPAVNALAGLEPVLSTNIQVFGPYLLGSHESQITLPSVCHELLPLRAGQRYKVCYQLGRYPKFRFERQSGSP